MDYLLFGVSEVVYEHTSSVSLENSDLHIWIQICLVYMPNSSLPIFLFLPLIWPCLSFIQMAHELLRSKSEYVDT